MQKTKTTRAINGQLFQPVREIEDIALEMGVSHQRCSFLLRTALAKLRAALEAKGVRSAKDILPD